MNTTTATVEDIMREGGMIGPPHACAQGLAACSCGETKAHEVMRRTTADGYTLSIWNDGAITHRRMGAYVRGLGAPRSQYGERTRARAVFAVADNLSLFDLAEVPRLVKIAESTFADNWRSEDDRRTWIRIKASTVTP